MSVMGRWTLYPSNYEGDAVAAEGEERLIAVGPDVRVFTEVVDAATHRGAVSTERERILAAIRTIEVEQYVNGGRCGDFKAALDAVRTAIGGQ